MKILRLIHSADPRGGGVIEGVRATTTELIGRGHEVDVLSLDTLENALKYSLNISLIALGPAKNGYGFCPKLDEWLAQHLAEYDCVIVEGIWQYHGLALWRAQRRLGQAAPPYYVFTHGMLDPWFKRTYPLKHLKKWLYWPWAEYRILRDAKAVLFTAEEERRLARQSFWLYRCNERIVHYGAQPPPQPPSKLVEAWRELPGCPKRPYLLYMGRLHPKKGADILIQAYREIASSCREPLPDLVLAGPEQDTTFTRRLHQLSNNHPQIHFIGMVTGLAKWGALLEAQALILPSHQENFGIVVAEALSMGTPALISNRINIWREVVDARAGWVADDTLEGVRQLLSQFIATPQDEMNAIRQRARVCFQDNFSFDRSVAALLNVLQSDHKSIGVDL